MWSLLSESWVAPSQFWGGSGQVLVDIGPLLVDPGPNLVEIGRFRTKLGQSGPNLVILGKLADVGSQCQLWTDSDRIWPIPNGACLISAKFDPDSANSPDLGKTSACVPRSCKAGTLLEQRNVGTEQARQ